MTPIKLMSRSGDIIGCIIVPDQARGEYIRNRQLHFYVPPEINPRPASQDKVELRQVVFIPAPMRDDAVMLVCGTLWDFERIKGCFFFAGYDVLRKGHVP